MSMIRKSARVCHISDGVLSGEEKLERAAEPDFSHMIPESASQETAKTASQMDGVNAHLTRGKS